MIGNRALRKRLRILSVLTIFFKLITCADAAEIHWTGGGGNGLWSNNSNWDVGVPGFLDDAVVDLTGDYTITVDTEASANTLQFGASSGTQALELSINTLNISTHATFATNTVVSLMGGPLIGTIDINGILNWSGSSLLSSVYTIGTNANLNIQGGSQTISSSTVTNRGVATWSATELTGNGNGNFVNEGTFILNANCQLTTVNFTNAGTIVKPAESAFGSLSISGNGIFSQQGTCRVETNATLSITAFPNNVDGVRFEPGAVFTGDGFMTWDGTFWMAGSVRVENTVGTSGTFFGNGSFSGPGKINWGGTLGSSGEITVASDFHLNLFQSWIYGTLNNNGTVTAASTISGDNGIGPSSFNNAGTFVVDGSCGFTTVNFTNTGTILKPAESAFGSLSVSGNGIFSQKGTCRVETNATLGISAFPNNVDGFRLEQGAIFTGDGFMSWDGTFWMAGSVRVENTVGTSGTFFGNGSFSGPGKINWGGTLGSSGEITVANDFHLNLFQSWIYGTLNNNGTVTAASTITGDNGTGPSAFINSGVFVVDGSCGFTTVNFTNTGTILKPAESAFGSLSVSGNGIFSQKGTCRVETNATLGISAFPNNVDGFRLEQGAVFTGDGFMSWDGTFCMAGSVRVENTVGTSGSFFGSGSFTGPGKINWGGTLGSSGEITVAPDFHLNLFQSWLYGTLNNNGTITAASTITGDNGNGPSALNNSGLFIVDGTCQLATVNFTNTGTILKPSETGFGSLSTSGNGIFSQKGICRSETNATLGISAFGNLIDGFRLEQGAVFTGDGQMFWDGTFWAAGSVRVENIIGTAASLYGTGTLAGPGTINWSGTFGGSADITLASDFHVNMFQSWLYGTLNNNGTVTCSSAITGDGGNGPSVFNNGGVFIVEANPQFSSLNFTNTGTILKLAESGYGSLSASGSGSFSQKGICRVETNSFLSIFANVTLEQGAIFTGDGQMNWAGTFWCAGNVRVENNISASVTFYGTGTLAGPGKISLQSGAGFPEIGDAAQITLASDFRMAMMNTSFRGTLNNYGTVDCGGYLVGGGTFNNRGLFTLHPYSDLQNGGTFNNLAGGTFRNISSNDPILNHFEWGFNNSGTLELVQGPLTLGDYAPASTANLRFPLAGLSSGFDFGLLNSGAFFASGGLSIVLSNGFVPANGNSFTVMNYPSRSGTFSSVQLPTLPQGLGWKTDFGTNALVLSVGEVAVISQQPQSQTVGAGSNASFNVVATGASAYQWKFNGSNLSGATESAYSIPSAQTNDAGSYSVIISNDFGSVTSSSAILTVVQPPVIVAQPHSRTNDAGTTATFAVAASGVNLTYQWKKGTNTLIDGGNIIGATTATITLTNVTQVDVGDYLVVVSNPGGTVTSDSAHLSVNDPVIVTQPLSQNKNAGTTLNLSVIGVGADPIGYQWKKNGTNLSNDIRIDGATNANITILNLIKVDQGTYTVDVIGATTVTSSNAIVTINDPAINASPTNLTVISNQFASFTVVAGGTPTLKYQWYSTTNNGLNATLLAGKTNAILTFASAKSLDTKGYFVVVTNVLGKATSAVAQLTVLLPPTIILQPVNYVGITARIAGNNAAFKIFAIGTAPLSYQWYFNGQIIPGATASNWIQINVQSTNAGTYSCVVTNISGIPATTPNTAGRLQVMADLIKPNIAITFPLANARLTNGLSYSGYVAPELIVSGTATDFGLITNVTLQRLAPVTESPISLPPNGALPGSKTWSNVVHLLDGTNVFKAVAYDSAGRTNSVTRSVFFVNRSTELTLVTNGIGSITSGGTVSLFSLFGEPTNQAPLEIGRNYTVLATPGFNKIFTNWTLVDDSLNATLASTNRLTFMMKSNLTLTANFIANPMLVSTGRYNGLFFETNGANIPNIKTHSAGQVANLNVTTNRVFSGLLSLDGRNFGLTGTFDLNGNATRVISRVAIGRSNLTVNLHLDWTGSSQITGTVSNKDSADPWVAPLLADLAVFNAGNLTTSSRYTMVIPPGDGAPFDSPGGWSYGGGTNTPLGATILVGKLADCTAISKGGAISKDGNWPLYLSLYGGRGLLEGWLNFSNGYPIGQVTWIRPETNLAPNFVIYTNGFTNIVNVIGSPYVKPPTGKPTLSNTNLILTIADADLDDLPLEWHVQLKGGLSFVVVTNASVTNKISGSFNVADGSFAIKFQPTGYTTNKIATGTVTQNDNLGRGSFLGVTNTGSVYLHP